MRMDWVPASAASLVAGVIALALASALLPAGGTAADSLEMSRQHDSRWLAVSVLFFAAAVAMTLGLPAILTLFHKRGAVLGLVGASVFLVGCVGTAGYAMLLAFFRALARGDAIRVEALDDVVNDPGLNAFLLSWVTAFYLGELLLGLAVLRAGNVPRWVPLVILAHVATLPLTTILPALEGRWTIVLMAAGFAGLAISANALHTRRSSLSRGGPGRLRRSAGSPNPADRE